MPLSSNVDPFSNITLEDFFFEPRVFSRDVSVSAPQYRIRAAQSFSSSERKRKREFFEKARDVDAITDVSTLFGSLRLRQRDEGGFKSGLQSLFL